MGKTGEKRGRRGRGAAFENQNFTQYDAKNAEKCLLDAEKVVHNLLINCGLFAFNVCKAYNIA